MGHAVMRCAHPEQTHMWKHGAIAWSRSLMTQTQHASMRVQCVSVRESATVRGREGATARGREGATVRGREGATARVGRRRGVDGGCATRNCLSARARTLSLTHPPTCTSDSSMRPHASSSARDTLRGARGVVFIVFGTPAFFGTHTCVHRRRRNKAPTGGKTH